MKRRVSQSTKAGIIFPVARVQKYLKKLPQQVKRVSKGSSAYLAAVLEYLTAEILELSGNCARDNHAKRITPRHFLLAVSLDQELNTLLKNVVIPGGGVLPHINNELFQKSDSLKTQNKVTTPVPRAKRIIPLKQALNKAVKAKAPLVKAASKTSKNVTTLSERTLNKGQKLVVLQANIVDVAADAIVHPTNSSFYLGGQVGSAISAKGGAEVRKIVADLQNKHGNLADCSVEISDASTNMLCKNIIHVHSPSWDTSNQPKKINDLTQVVKNILTLADTNKLKTIALPSISSGGNGYPKQLAAQTILRAINSYFKELEKAGTVANSTIEKVIFVLYDTDSVNIYTSELGKMDNFQ